MQGELLRFKSLTKTYKKLWITAREERKNEVLTKRVRLLPSAVLLKVGDVLYKLFGRLKIA